MEEHLLPAPLAGIADRLLECGAIKMVEQDGEAPVVVNLRTSDHPTSPGSLSREVVARIGWAIARHLDHKHIHFDTVAGIPHAGTPIARAIAAHDRDSITCLSLEKRERREGTHHTYRYTFGFDSDQSAPEHPHVVLVDTTLGPTSTREGVELFQRNGVRVRYVAAVLDLNNGVCEALAYDRFEIHSLFSLRGLCHYYLATGQITEHQHLRVMAHLDFPVF